MKALYSSVIMSILITHFHFCYSDETLGILIRHPRVYQLYKNMVTQEGLNPDLLISHVVPPESRAKLCKLTLNAKIFNYAGEHGAAVGQFEHKPIGKTLELKHVDDLYKKDLMSDLNYVDVLTNIDGTEYYVKAILCSMDEKGSILIADGIKSDAYFVLMKESSDKTLEMAALLQPSPFLHSYVHPRITNEQLRMEKTFLNQYKKRGINFCTLPPYERFRVCSAAYIALNEYKKIDVPKNNYMRMNAQDCIKKAEVIFTSVTPNESVNFQSIVVDLLPCAVNNADLTKPQFFVHHDPTTGDGAYVFELVENNKFSIAVHIEKLNMFPEVWNQIKKPNIKKVYKPAKLAILNSKK